RPVAVAVSATVLPATPRPVATRRRFLHWFPGWPLAARSRLPWLPRRRVVAAGAIHRRRVDTTPHARRGSGSGIRGHEADRHRGAASGPSRPAGRPGPGPSTGDVRGAHSGGAATDSTTTWP